MYFFRLTAYFVYGLPTLYGFYAHLEIYHGMSALFETRKLLNCQEDQSPVVGS